MKVTIWKEEMLKKDEIKDRPLEVKYYNETIDEFLNKFNIDNLNCYMFYENTGKFYKDSFYNIIFNIIKDWEEFNMSPYSDSVYNSNNIDWGNKPENSLRISNHWNFTTQDSLTKKHCIMEDESLNHNWLLCQYKDGVYRVIKNITEEFNKYEQQSN